MDGAAHFMQLVISLREERHDLVEDDRDGGEANARLVEAERKHKGRNDHNVGYHADDVLKGIE